MTLRHYIDNEVPWDAPAAYGEWDARVQVGGSTIARAAGDLNGRGSYRLEVSVDAAGNNAYMQRDLTDAIAAGQWWWAGFYYQPGATVYSRQLLRIKASYSFDDCRVLNVGSTLAVCIREDDYSWNTSSHVGALTAGSPSWIVVGIKRATGAAANDGEAILYQDGVEIGHLTGLDLYSRWGTIKGVVLGAYSNSAATFTGYLDELKIAAGTYPEPYVPTPSGDYVCPERVVVLWRFGNADSSQFADYCVTELGIPRSNLIPLPNATAGETLASYATFQGEVETDLADWFTRNPTVAANCMCFLPGFGVPGYFTHASVKHSAASRLMNYGTAFSSQTDNPLYDPSTVARLTKTGLGGKYLACRVDADTLQHAKDIIDAAATVAGLSELADSDKLYSDDSTYRASLACQHLRILTAALGTYSGDAFIWGDGAGGESFADLAAGGDPSPDCSGGYVENGTYTSKPAYERCDGAYWIW